MECHDNNSNKPSSKETILKGASIGTIGGTLAGASTYVGIPLLASSLGFGSGGIVAGTTAASMMSAAGSVTAGSLVAGLQSIGATGAVALGATVLPVTLVVGAGVGAGYYYWNRAHENDGHENALLAIVPNESCNSGVQIEHSETQGQSTELRSKL